MESFTPNQEQSLRRKEAKRWEMECFNHARDVDKSLWELNKTEERHAGADSAAESKDRKEEPAKNAPQSSQKPDRA